MYLSIYKQVIHLAHLLLYGFHYEIHLFHSACPSLLGQLNAQETLRLTLNEVVALPGNSRHKRWRHGTNIGRYWNWRSFKADYLPSLTFSSSSQLNRSISPILTRWTDSFVQRNQLLNGGVDH